MSKLTKKMVLTPPAIRTLDWQELCVFHQYQRLKDSGSRIKLTTVGHGTFYTTIYLQSKF